VGYSLGGEWGGELTRELRELGPFDVGRTDHMWGGRLGSWAGLEASLVSHANFVR
jgi:hypothetical protein